MRRKTIKEINTSSMADISFLLLIFFLVTTSLNINTGINRKLPPLTPNDKIKEELQIKKRNILEVKLDADNRLFVQNKKIKVEELRHVVKEFIENSSNNPNLPEKRMVYVRLLGNTAISTNHVIYLKIDAGTKYQAYIDVQNELIVAYEELRNEFSNKKFGKRFNQLTPEQQVAIQQVYTQRISEAEIKNDQKEHADGN